MIAAVACALALALRVWLLRRTVVSVRSKSGERDEWFAVVLHREAGMFSRRIRRTVDVQIISNYADTPTVYVTWTDTGKQAEGLLSPEWRAIDAEKKRRHHNAVAASYQIELDDERKRMMAELEALDNPEEPPTKTVGQMVRVATDAVFRRGGEPSIADALSSRCTARGGGKRCVWVAGHAGNRHKLESATELYDVEDQPKHGAHR